MEASSSVDTATWNAELKAHALTAGDALVFQPTTPDPLDVARGFTAVVLARPDAAGQTGDLVTLADTGGNTIARLGADAGIVEAECPGSAGTPIPAAGTALHAQAEGLGVYALVVSDDATNAKVYVPDASGNFLHAGVGVSGCGGFSTVGTAGALAAGYSLTLGGPAGGTFAGLLGEAFVAPRALSRAELGLAIHGLAGYDGTEPTGDHDRFYTFDGDLHSYHDRGARRRAAAENEAAAVGGASAVQAGVQATDSAALSSGTEVYAPAPARRLYALELAAGQTLVAPVAGAFDWASAWTVAAWLRAQAIATSGCDALVLTDGTAEAGLTVPEFDPSVPRSYPPVAYFATNTITTTLTSYTLTVPDGAAYGEGDYILTVSRRNTNYDSLGVTHLFSRISDENLRLVFGASAYATTTPYAALSTAPDLLGNGILAERGDWVKIEVPHALYLHKVFVYSVSDEVQSALLPRAPGAYRIYGDNNDNAWVLLHEVTGATYADVEKCTSEAAGDAYAQDSRQAHIYTVATVNAHVAYTRFAIIFTKVYGAAGFIDIAGMELQATEAPPVAPAWTHVALTHALDAPDVLLHVDGGAGVSTGINPSAWTAGGSVNITGAAVDDVRVYQHDHSADVQQAGAPAAAACPAGQAIGIRNLARECGATFDQPCSTTASSQLDASNGDYALINDGNTDASFYTGANDPAWIRIDLGEERVIKSVQIDMHNGEYERIDRFMLIVGGANARTDGTTACYTDTTGYTAHTVIDVTCAGTGQYVFLEQPAKTDIVNHLHIREMRVYGERCADICTVRASTNQEFCTSCTLNGVGGYFVPTSDSCETIFSDATCSWTTYCVDIENSGTVTTNTKINLKLGSGCTQGRLESGYQNGDWNDGDMLTRKLLSDCST